MTLQLQLQLQLPYNTIHYNTLLYITYIHGTLIVPKSSWRLSNGQHGAPLALHARRLVTLHAGHENGRGMAPLGTRTRDLDPLP